MNYVRSLRSIGRASGDGPVDWSTVERAAKDATAAGRLDLDSQAIDEYRRDVKDARGAIKAETGLEFNIPESIEIHNRHHWIATNVSTFRRVMAPVEAHWQSIVPDMARVINTGTMTILLSYLAKNVLGQYDPILLADGDDAHGLYFVHPNIGRVSEELSVDRGRFRRWIAFHEVAHAAEFSAAPWLGDHLERQLTEGIESLSRGTVDREAFREMNTTMTVVEGYAETVMDRSIDFDPTPFREKLDARRRGGGPITRVIRRFLGLEIKRRQYERGKRFFESIVDEQGIVFASSVWEHPDALPSSDELENPPQWIARIEGTAESG